MPSPEPSCFVAGPQRWRSSAQPRRCCTRLLSAWHLRWGAEPQDEQRELPGDELLPEGGTRILHAVTIQAPVEQVWPWLAQLGQDRGGFYSYEWLENSSHDTTTVQSFPNPSEVGPGQ